MCRNNLCVFYSLEPCFKLCEQYVDKWCEILISHVLRTQKFLVPQNDPIFENKQIQRRIQPELQLKVFQQLIQQQTAILKQNGIEIQPLSIGKSCQITTDCFKRSYLNDDVFTFQEVRESLQGTVLQNVGNDFILKVL